MPSGKGIYTESARNTHGFDMLVDQQQSTVAGESKHRRISSRLLCRAPATLANGHARRNMAGRANGTGGQKSEEREDRRV